MTLTGEVDLSAFEPVAEQSFGRRRRVLVSRWDEVAEERLGTKLGPGLETKLEVDAASLEEIVVAMADRATAHNTDHDVKRDKAT